MSRLPMFAWLLIPIALTGLHFGPGQRWLARDDAAGHLRRADDFAQKELWDQAAEQYRAALAALPNPQASERLPLEVSLAKALVMSGEILDGQERLSQSLVELEKLKPANPTLAKEARYDLGMSSYYAAWLMRLERGTADEWLPEAERARQQFRLLADAAEEAGDAAIAAECQRSLEATIRLEQMDLSELLARPKPKTCPQCKGGLCQRKRKQGLSKCESEGKGKSDQPEEDPTRKEIKKQSGAGLHYGGNQGS